MQKNTEREDYEYSEAKSKRKERAFFLALGLTAVGTCGIIYLSKAKNRKNDAAFHADVFLNALNAIPHQDSVVRAFPLTKYIHENYPSLALDGKMECDGIRYHADQLIRLYKENPEELSALYADTLDKRYNCREGIATFCDDYLDYILNDVPVENHELSDELFIAYVNCLANLWRSGSYGIRYTPPSSADVLRQKIRSPEKSINGLKVLIEKSFYKLDRIDCVSEKIVVSFEAARLLKNEDIQNKCVEYYQQCIAYQPAKYLRFVSFEIKSNDIKTPLHTIREIFGKQTFEEAREQVWLAYREPEKYLKLIHEK